MANDQIEITFRVDAGEAAALLKFLRRVPFHDIKRALDWADEVRAFEGESGKLRVTMRKILEGDRGAVHIACIGGSCPVQAEGTVDGKPFYFRARHKHWYMGIGGDPMTEPAWFRRTQWGTGEFAAGYMPEDEARRLIEQCAADYSAGTLRLPKFP